MHWIKNMFLKYLFIFSIIIGSGFTQAENTKIFCESPESKSLSQLFIEFDESLGTLIVDGSNLGQVNITSSTITGYKKVTLDSETSSLLGSDSQLNLLGKYKINRIKGELELTVVDIGGGFKEVSSLIYICQPAKAKF